MPNTENAERTQLARDLVISILSIVSVGIGIHLLSEEEGPRVVWLEMIDLAIVVLFWIDLFRKGSGQGGLRAYVKKHWWELPSLMPTIPALVDAFPGFALLRVVRILRLFRVIGVILRLRPAGDYVVRLARAARIGDIFGIGASVVILGWLLAHSVESRVNPNMGSWGQSAWFALNMFTNVAYLDFQPVTFAGKVLAGILQVCGIAFIGVFTASLAAAISDDHRRRDRSLRSKRRSPPTLG